MSSTDPGWKGLLDSVEAVGDLWSGSRRQDRPGWSDWLEKARRLLAEPRSPLPKDVVDVILRGDISQLDNSRLPNSKNKVAVFISSTFTDTKTERNALIRDVYPFLRLLCRMLGMDFGAVDMRWGVSEETTREHGTTNMCLREIHRCLDSSAGPAFVCILGNKYGYRPFPAEIEQSEFERLLSAIESLQPDSAGPMSTEDLNKTTLLRHYFRLDLNAVPPTYVLKVVDEKEDVNWRQHFEVIQYQLRLASNRTLDPAAGAKYMISVTEDEVTTGVFNNPARDNQVIVLNRELEAVTSPNNVHRHIIDVVQIPGKSAIDKGEIDSDAQQLLQKLKTEKMTTTGPKEDNCISVVYTGGTNEQVAESVRRTCDELCQRLVNAILDGYRRSRLNAEPDAVFDEVLRHRTLARDKIATFVGRDGILTAIAGYFRFDCSVAGSDAPDRSRLLAVHGSSGCGKTALLAVAAAKVHESVAPVLVLRFLGTSIDSSSARSVLHSICNQLVRVYHDRLEQVDNKPVPESFKELTTYFRKCLDLATAERPLVIVLDSLDQLTNEDFGRDLRWLPIKDQLPPHVRIVVSTLPGRCLEVLSSLLPTNNLLSVGAMDPDDGPRLLDKFLSPIGRTVTANQRRLLLDSFAKCSMPLYLRLAADEAARWRSFTEVDQLPADIRGLVGAMFDRLETRYGRTFVGHALGYLTATKNGLAVSELEDVLSSDDAVLDEVFAYWVPPIRRLPPLLWVRVRNDLGPYIVERGTDGVAAYAWYHRQFWETARARYLDDDVFIAETRRAIADYFHGRWVGGKPRRVVVHVGAGGSGQQNQVSVVIDDRQLPDQPIAFDEQRDRDSTKKPTDGPADDAVGSTKGPRTLNRRKLRELPYQLIRLRDCDGFADVSCRLDWIEAKFEAGQGYDCLAEFQTIARFASGSDRKIQAWAKFIGANLGHFIHRPSAVYQVASQQVWSNPVRRHLSDEIKMPDAVKLVSDVQPEDAEDPCELTLFGHTSGVRCCSYSADGTMIASTSEDGSLRIWDTGMGHASVGADDTAAAPEAELGGGGGAGSERLVVTGLPGPTYPALADPYHGERPCCFSKNGRQVATGSEDGWLQVWDLNGAQVFSAETNASTITGLRYSNNGTMLAVSSKDCSVSIYSVPGYQLVSKISVIGPAMGCDWSADDSRLCVALSGGLAGLALIDTSTCSVVSQERGYIDLNICCAYSPNSSQVATGGSDSSITLWDATRGHPQQKLTGHKGWIWGVTYTPDGSTLISCSSDRSIKLWDMSKGQSIVSLGGHLHRVCWASVWCDKTESGNRGNDKLVTSSLDCSLKIWNLNALLTPGNRFPTVGGLHYIFLRVSPTVLDGGRSFIVSNQGWGSACQLSSVSIGSGSYTVNVQGSAAQHAGFIETAAFALDSSVVISIDTGHGGQYTPGAVRNAAAKVSSVPSGSELCRLAATAPTSVACSRSYIVIGTADNATVHAFSVTDYQLICSWSFNDSGSTIDDHVTSVSCSATSDDVAAAIGSLVKIWNLSVASTENVATFVVELPNLGSQIKRVLYSPDGQNLAITTISGTIELWKVELNSSGSERYHSPCRLPGGHVSLVRDVGFSPDSRLLASAAVEMRLFVWDVAGRRLAAAWYGPVSSLDFVTNDTIVVGEATGNRRFLKLQL